MQGLGGSTWFGRRCCGKPAAMAAQIGSEMDRAGEASVGPVPAQVRPLVLSLSALLCACISLGCSKETKPVAEEPKVPAASETAAAHQADPAPGESPPAANEPGEPAAPSGDLKSQVSEDSFDLKVEPSGSYAVGTEGQVQIVLDAKAPFHVNKEYPYSFALNESPGVKFASMKVQKDAVKLEAQRATMSVPFTPSEAGAHTISGTFKFSVCTDEQCLIKKQELALSVDVK